MFQLRNRENINIKTICFYSNKLTLKAPITTAAADKFCDIFPNFQIKGMIFYENCDSHQKKRQNLKLSSAANYRLRFMG